MKIEPYTAGLIKENPYKNKRIITGKIIVILDIIINERKMKLIHPISRALTKYSICELAITNEPNITPGSIVNNVGFIGFMEIIDGGVAVIGDKVYVEDNLIGVIAGFNEDHAPNHITILIKGNQLTTGTKLGIDLEDTVKIMM